MRTWPAERLARGWYQIAWSYELAVAEAVPLEYFERELVAYRGESNQLHVLDGHCAHCGGHLGYGATIERDTIRCPRCACAWGPDGAQSNTSADAMADSVRVRAWKAAEVDDLALVYFSSDPRREPEPLPASLNRYDVPVWPVTADTTCLWQREALAPQVVGENGVDAAHFKFVHRSADVATLEYFGSGERCFEARLSMQFGAGRTSTWATPSGPVDGQIFTEQWGVGISRSQLASYDDITYVLCATPITPYLSDLRATAYIPMVRGDGTQLDEVLRNRWMTQQNLQVDADIQIWRHQSYLHRPALDATERAPLRELRRWARNLYDD